MIISQTEHLVLRHIEISDSEFVLNLYNQPAFLEHIGDRGLNSLEDAENFIRSVQKNYRSYGFWLYLVEEKSTRNPVGVNSLIQRDYLDLPDIGFAIDQKHWRKGFANESSRAVLHHASDLGYKELFAITSPDNQSSIKLLLKLGFNFSKCDDFEGNGEPTNLYNINLLD